MSQYVGLPISSRWCCCSWGRQGNGAQDDTTTCATGTLDVSAEEALDPLFALAATRKRLGERLHALLQTSERLRFHSTTAASSVVVLPRA